MRRARFLWGVDVHREGEVLAQRIEGLGLLYGNVGDAWHADGRFYI